MARRKRKVYPKFVMWSATDQRRMVDAVERLYSIVNDLEKAWRAESTRRSTRSRPKQARSPATSPATADSKSE